MSVLFLSHSSRNDKVAREVLAWLESQGHESVFVVHDNIEGGEPWEDRLYTELRRCRALIALVSADWLQSKWCIAEVNHAQALRRVVIPLHIASCGANGKIGGLLAARGPPAFSRVQAIDWLTDDDAKLRLGRTLESLGLDAKSLFVWKGDRPPFPGYPPFESADAPVFFGRDNEIVEILSQLDGCRAKDRTRLLVIQGASGSGKSSLLRAGIIPRLERDLEHWIVVPPFRPLNNPFNEMFQALSSIASKPLPAPPPTDQRDEAECVRTSSEWICQAAQHLRTERNRLEATVSISIDQFEESVNRTEAASADASLSDRGTRFLLALRDALAQSDHRLLVIATLRTDTIGALQRHRALRERADTGDVISTKAIQLGALPKTSFHAIIQGPADLAGLTFGSGLVGRIVD